MYIVPGDRLIIHGMKDNVDGAELSENEVVSVSRTAGHIGLPRVRNKKSRATHALIVCTLILTIPTSKGRRLMAPNFPWNW